MADALYKPVRIANDTDMQGLGVVGKKGLEMVITWARDLGQSY